jgi:hypothetical protein
MATLQLSKRAYERSIQEATGCDIPTAKIVEEMMREHIWPTLDGLSHQDFRRGAKKMHAALVQEPKLRELYSAETKEIAP